MLLGWVSFLTDVASDMIYPLLPDFLTRTLEGRPRRTRDHRRRRRGDGLAHEDGLGLVVGSASSRRKPIVVAGYAIASVVRPLVGLAANWGQVLAIRFADRVGKGIRTSPRDALIADMVPPEGRGRPSASSARWTTPARSIGPLLAALLLKFVFEDERSVFLLAAIPGLAAVALLIFGVRETPRAAPACEPRGRELRGALPRRFWIAIGIFVLFASRSRPTPSCS